MEFDSKLCRQSEKSNIGDVSFDLQHRNRLVDHSHLQGFELWDDDRSLAGLCPSHFGRSNAARKPQRVATRMMGRMGMVIDLVRETQERF